ncbi:MAG: InlB B-repeat-containing protein [Oscillospiraceae bacterium]|nr:InlB B-repeat-containing protein [Clostridia bacterium]MBP3698412.1 InlB B-repeat-containing protein [Oscillospiraceae bacterium]
MKEYAVHDQLFIATWKCKHCSRIIKEELPLNDTDYTVNRDIFCVHILNGNEQLSSLDFIKLTGVQKYDNDLVIHAYRLQYYSDSFKKISKDSKNLYRLLQSSFNREKGDLSKKDISTIEKKLGEYTRLLKRHRLRICLCSGLVSLAVFISAGIIMYREVSRTTEVFDPSLGISVVMYQDSFDYLSRKNISLSAEIIHEHSPEYAIVSSFLRNESERFTIYDLYLLQNGNIANPTAPVKVSLPLPETYRSVNVCVYHVEKSGEMNMIPSQISPDKKTISFETDHFSLFALVEVPYTVVFSHNGMSDHLTEKVLWGNYVNRPADPSLPGYTFDGWYYDGQLWDFDRQAVSKDIRLTAHWIPNTYTVRLESELGTLLTQELTVEYCEYLVLEQPVAEGYTFLGWYKDDMKFEEGAWEFTEDLTLRARWEKNPYTFTVYTQGSEEQPQTETLLYGDTIALPSLDSFEKKGYSFGGWFFDPETTIPFTAQTMPSEDITAYAKWIPNEYTLTVDPADGVTPPVQITVTYDQSFTLPIFTRDGYEFDGIDWQDAEPIGDVWSIDRDVTVLAKWVKYTVYTGVSSTPSSISDPYVIIDWTGYSSSNTKGKALRFEKSVKKIHIKGSKNVEFYSTSIAFTGYSNNALVELKLDDFKFSGFTEEGKTGLHAITHNNDLKTFSLTVTVVGECTVRTTGIGQTAILLAGDLTVKGDGTLSVTGGNGDFSSEGAEHGGDGIRANNMYAEGNVTIAVFGGNGDSAYDIKAFDGANGGNGIVLSGNLKTLFDENGNLNVYGGHGGAAYDRKPWENSGNGSNGEDGRTGGNGGVAIVAKNMILKGGSHIFHGGNGGEGGDASECNNIFFNKKKGGKGGDGGDGGAGIQAPLCQATATTIVSIGGTGGNSGMAGGIHQGDGVSGGKVGDRGIPGVGGAISTGTIACAPDAQNKSERGKDGEVNLNYNQD